MIKEIIDHFPENEFTLKDIVKVRPATRDVEEAITRLQGKAPKRRKREEPRGDDVLSHRHGTKHSHGERIDFTPSVADASANQTTDRKPNRSVLSKRETMLLLTRMILLLGLQLARGSLLVALLQSTKCHPETLARAIISVSTVQN